MEKIIDKLSNYHIVNYIVPGYIFTKVLAYLLDLKIGNFTDIIIVSYFVGIVISRISSLLMEKVLYKIFKIKSQPYSLYINASKKDSKIETLTQDLNMYRSFFSAFVTLSIILILKKIYLLLKIDKTLVMWLLLISLSILFAFSYVKQVKFIIERVKNANEDN